MIRSMTGFGRAELKSHHGFIRAEIKTTNHKFFEISLRLPQHLAEYEEDVRKLVAREVRRGKITVSVNAPDPLTYSTRLFLNEPLAKEVHQKISRLRKILGADAGSDRHVLSEVLRYPDVLTKDLSVSRGASFSRELSKAVTLSLANLKESRLAEGRALEKDLRRHLAEIKKALGIIEKRLPVIAKEYKANLEKKVKNLLPGAELDRERLTLEVALYVKNSDITEEVTRLKSHLDGMQRAFGDSGELGRKIDFIGQEMTRESNTIGAKSSDVVIANQVIQIKSAIEKIREQSQNVE